VDEATLRTFLRDGYPRIVGAVALVTGSLPAAEDAVQEAVLRAWQRTERGEPIDSLDSWVVTVALNLSRSGLRRLRTERRARPHIARAEATPGPSGDVVDVRRALASLPNRQREAAVLRYFLDLSTAEIAAAMATSEGTVKSQLSKARGHLASALALETDEENDHVEA
jgi:RNA polymerase sigma-70 factor, ECF subfamily